MEKVWEELKKIEAQAEQIQIDAQNNAKKIALVAKQDAEKLIENSKNHAEEEAEKIYSTAIKEADQNYAECLKLNQQIATKLKVQAIKNMDQAVKAIINAVLEENTS
jgi:vacuolar-type H+-ATPase subunit H